MYVVYEDGVYRHKTVTFALIFEECLSSIVEYFKKSDDYHILSVEYLNLQTGEVEGVCEFSQKVNKVPVKCGENGRYWSASVIHGECTIFKDGQHYLTYDREAVLTKYQSFIVNDKP